MKKQGVHDNERGAVLVIGLLFLIVLTILGVVAALYTTNELAGSRNYRQAREAFYAAEAGVEEALVRLKGSGADDNYAGDPAVGPDSLWVSYLSSSADWQSSDDPDYHLDFTNYFPVPGGSKTSQVVSANSLQNTMSYAVKIRHKREYDAEQDGHNVLNVRYFDTDGSLVPHSAAPNAQGNVIYYAGYQAGFPLPVQYTVVPGTPTDYYPVEVITATGSSGSSEQVIRVEAVRNPGPQVFAALYSKGNVGLNGSAMTINGTDNCGAASGKPPVYTRDPAITTTSGTPIYGGTPAAPVSGLVDVEIQKIVESYTKGRLHRLTADDNSGDVWPLGVYYCKTTELSPPGELALKVEGSGVLVVEGDLKMFGGFQWDGIVLVTGDLTFAGGGSGINIRGAVLSDGTATVSGNLDIRYDSCAIENSVTGLSSTIISWKQLH